MRLTNFLLFTCLFWSPAKGQDREKKLDSLFSYYASEGMLNGSVLVAERGKILYRKSFGIANAEWNIPATDETKYMVGSLSKQFVAILILQLVQEGKLRLSDKISAYVPQVSGEKSGITIHQLLSHTSGLPHFNAMPDFMNEWQSRHSRKQWLDKLLEMKMTPSEKPTYHYSGPGYFLLGLLVEHLRKMPLSAAYHKYIFAPAGMKHSLSVEEISKPAGKLSYPYLPTASGLVNGRFRDPSTMVGAGDIITTVDDYFHYHQALKGNILLNPSSMKLLLKPYFENEGYSLTFTRFVSPETNDSTNLVFFTGQLSGYTSLAYHVWEDDKLIVTFYNVDNPRLYDIGDKALRILYGRSNRMPKKSVTNYLRARTTSTSLEDAIHSFLALNPDEKEKYELNPGELNGIGYTYIRNEMFSEAILIFKMNVALFPAVGDTYDSLGEAYYLAGLYADALANYRKALELDNRNTNAANMIAVINSKIRKE